MNLKTYANHLLELSKAVITKNEINAISAFLNRLRFSNNKDSQLKYSELLLDIIFNKKGGYKITKDQKEFGIKWLNDRYFKKNGENRVVADRELTEDQVNIIKNFKEFRFVGYTAEWNNYGACYTFFIPVYRVIDKEGNSFDYAPMYMGNPIIEPETITVLSF